MACRLYRTTRRLYAQVTRALRTLGIPAAVGANPTVFGLIALYGTGLVLPDARPTQTRISQVLPARARDALKGMTKTLGKTRNLVVACHDLRADCGDGEYFRTRAEVVATLRAAGFVVADPPANATVYVRDHVHAWRAG